MTIVAFIRRASHWVLLCGAAYTIVDWFSPRSDREPNFLLWVGLSVVAAELVGGVWSRKAAVLAALGTGVAYLAVVVALQAVTDIARGTGIWRPSPAILAWWMSIIAVAAYSQAGSARRRATQAGATDASSSA